jgi:hypothetical protein
MRADGEPAGRGGRARRSVRVPTHRDRPLDQYGGIARYSFKGVFTAPTAERPKLWEMAGS